MNNDTGENGERRKSQSVTLQWYSCDQSKTMALKYIILSLTFSDKFGTEHSGINIV